MVAGKLSHNRSLQGKLVLPRTRRGRANQCRAQEELSPSNSPEAASQVTLCIARRLKRTMDWIGKVLAANRRQLVTDYINLADRDEHVVSCVVVLRQCISGDGVKQAASIG